MAMNRRHLLRSCAGLLPFASTRGLAQSFPTKPVSLLVGFPPGGPTDVTARVLQPLLQKALGGTVIVENVPGAGGSLAIQKMLNAPADGHVLFLGTVSDAVVTPMAIAGAKYKAESLVLVNKLSESEFVLVARPALDIKDVADLVAQTKNRDMSYGSFGIGSLIHLVMEDFRAKTGASLLHVPYQGMSPVITAVMGGQIDLALLPIAGPTVNLIREGKVKPLFLTGSKRLPQLPNVPSADESALLRGFHHHIWPGIFVASATPKELVGKLNGIFAPIALSPEFRRFWDESGASITEPQLTVAQAARFYADDTARFRAIAQSIKLEAN